MENYHVAIIPDRNRRWARKETRERFPRFPDDDDLDLETLLDWLGEEHPSFVDHISKFDPLPSDSSVEILLTAFGHWKNRVQMEKVWEWARERPINEVSLWGLSRDNIAKRNDTEVAFLNYTYRKLLENVNEEGSLIHQNRIQVRALGELSLLDDELRAAVDEIQRSTSDYQNGRLNLVLGYDGRWDVAQAVQSAEIDRQTTRVSEVDPDETPDYDRTVERIQSQLELPAVDVLLAYGPDRSHLSDFANMQVGQATLCFPRDWSKLTADGLGRLQAGEVADEVLPKKHWPDSEAADLDYAIRLHEFRSETLGA
jgi:undecaprenyl diphosphate synthase